MAHLANFSFEFFYEIFTEDASRLLLYDGAKKSKMTKSSNQGVLPSILFIAHVVYSIATQVAVTRPLAASHLDLYVPRDHAARHLARLVFSFLKLSTMQRELTVRNLEKSYVSPFGFCGVYSAKSRMTKCYILRRSRIAKRQNFQKKAVKKNTK